MGGIGRKAAVVCDCWPRRKDFPAELDKTARGEFDQDSYCECLDNSSFVQEHMAFSWYELSHLGQAFHHLFCSGQPRRHAHDFTPPPPANEDQQLPVIPYYVEDNYQTLLKVTDENNYRQASICGHELELSTGEAAAFHAELERLRLDLDGRGDLDSACLEALRRPCRLPVGIHWVPSPDHEFEDCRQWMLRACDMCVDKGFRLRFSSE